MTATAPLSITGQNLLLLFKNDSWLNVVNDGALALGCTLASTASPEAALAAIACHGGAPLHVLLQPEAAGAFLPSFHALAHESFGHSSGSTAQLVMLDAAPDAATQAQGGASRWLYRMLDTGPTGNRRARAKPEHPLAMAELREALTEGRIHTRYQPIVRIDDGMPVGLEVLARLEHPTRGTLPPDLFVPQIEDAGLAGKLTEAVIRRAFADWGGDMLAAYDVTLALNFPLDVLLSDDALAWLENERLAAGIDARRLVIELTESRPVSRVDELRAVVGRLRDIGYGLAIDDVGPDIRDHSALLDLPFTALKLDKNLVRESQDSATTQDFLDRTIEAARLAKLTIIAEGVEDHDIWGRMKGLAVHEAQGFLIARPLPLVAVPIWHRDWCARHGLPKAE